MEHQERHITGPKPNLSFIDDPDIAKFERSIQYLRSIIETKVQLEKVFNSIHHKLNRGYPSDEILNSLFNSMNKVIPYDRMGIALLEDDQETIRLQWVNSKMGTRYLEKNYSAPIKGSSLKDVIDSGKPRIINDLQAYLYEHPNSESTKLALQDGIRSSLTCPLILSGKPLGVIFFSSGTVNTYKVSHRQLFCEISEGISLIVEQGLLKQAVSQSTSMEKIFRRTIHDLSNPLSIIQGMLALIEKKEWFKQLPEESKRNFQMLKRNSDSMVNLIQELVYQRKENKPLDEIKKGTIRLETFINELKGDCEIMTLKKNIIFSLNKANDLPVEANLDSNKIKIAICNLIANSVKYSYENTHVSLHVDFDKQTHRLIFSVIDQGQGIKETELGNLFKEYGTTSNVTTAGEGSKGLGLANVKRIVELHNGDVFVRSKFGSGSTFGFWIPV